MTFDDYLARSADPLFPRAGAPESLSRPIWEILERGPSTVDVLSVAATLSLGWGISVIGAMAKMGVVELTPRTPRLP